MSRQQGSEKNSLSELLAEGFDTVPEAAKYLRLCRATVYVLMDRGELASARFGKARRIPRRALREYAERCLVGGLDHGAD